MMKQSGRGRVAILAVTFLVSVIVLVQATPARAGTEWLYAHIDRFGVMTWTPTKADPDFYDSSVSPYRRILESDIVMGSDFRTEGHGDVLVFPGYTYYTTYEWEFFLQDAGWSLDYDGYFICDLPQCVADTNIDDDGTYRNYAAVSGFASGINANTTYNIEIGTFRGPLASTNVQLGSIASAASTSCPYSDVEYCSFENYRHLYNKVREHTASSAGWYGWYDGGSYVTDNTFSPCPGSWGFSAGNVDYWCYSGSNGPEPPGRVTIRPKAGYSSGYAYRTVARDIDPGDDFSVEYVVQCLTGNPCKGRLGWQGRGITTDTKNSATFTIPNDGWYYLCRFDSKHGATSSANYHNTQLRARLFNTKAGTQLRIDAMAIYGWVFYDDYSSGPTCKAMSPG
ncbi:MAG: hypothetical protein KJ698_04420 [Actinobacteria bacterium]|nr:hypothetical protein [Actinomycetota bacterium]